MLKEDVIKTVWEMREFQGDSAEFKGRMSLNRGAERVLKGHEELEESLINLVKGMRGGGQPLNAPVLRAVLEGVVEVKAPQLLRSNGGPWGLSENWVKEWIRSKLGWSFRVATTAAQKLPKDWEHQLDMMAYRAAFEVLTHGVPAELMVNMDQTAMHLVPSGGSRTYDKRGKKEIAVTGVEDKRQITICVSSAADGTTLPPQLIFQGKSSRSLPSGPTVRELHHGEGWRFKYTQNHWSTLGTTKEWVEENLLPYYKKVRHIRTNQLASDFNHLPGNSSQLGASNLDQTSCIRFESDKLHLEAQLNQTTYCIRFKLNQTS